MNKDVYEYITNFADDPTILNMFSVNKKFHSEEYFSRLMRRKYPLLLTFKTEKESMKHLFLRMSSAIAKTKFKYLPLKKYDPYYFSQIKNNDDELFYVAHAGHLEAVKYMLEHDLGNLWSYSWAITITKEVEIVKLLIQKGVNNFNVVMFNASKKGHIEIVKLMLENGADNFELCLNWAAYNGHLDIVQLMLKNNVDTSTAIEWATEAGHREIVELLR